MSLVSTNYRELTTPEEIESVAAECAAAWKDPEIPMRQYEECVKPELEALAKGKGAAPFVALARCLERIPEVWAGKLRLLDVGASSGYYAEAMRLMGADVDYTGLDFSPAFKELAERLYPGIRFDIGDARSLPYPDNSFECILNGAVLMHTRDYPEVIASTARVTKQYAIFHRTPVFAAKPTIAYLKDGYGCPMLEWHFNETEILELFTKNRMRVIHTETVFWVEAEGFGHRTYLLEKAPA